MSRTRRCKHYGNAGVNRDGRPPDEGKPLPRDFAIEVTRRDRRTRQDEAGKTGRGEIDPDDTPAPPRPKRLWQFWRRW